MSRINLENKVDVSPSKADQGNFKELKQLIATLTHTGEKVLDPPVLKGITRICKISNDYVIHSYNLLMGHLEAKHSEVRFSSFQICVELFKRSHCFRELLVSNLEQIMILTAETNPSKSLPPPKATALALKKLALTTFRNWAKEYGTGYKKLLLGISFLKNCKRVDLNAMALEEAAELSRQDELVRRRKALQNERLKKVQEEMKEKQPDIVNALIEMENCLGLLLPRPEDFFIENDGNATGSIENQKLDLGCEQSNGNLKETNSPPLSEADTCDDDPNDYVSAKDPIFDFRKYGIINPHFSITLKVDPEKDPLIRKNDENAIIFENAQDLFKLVCNCYQPCIVKWETILEKCADLDTSTTEEVLKRISDLKLRLENIIDKYKRLNMNAFSTKSSQKDDDSDTSDSDFEEVQNKEGFEIFSKSDPVKPNVNDLNRTHSPKKDAVTACTSKKDWTLISDENHEKDPTSALSTLATMSMIKSSITDTVSTLVDQRPCSSKDVKTQKKVCSSDEKSGSFDERKTKLMSIAPKLPFDVDLYHWEDEKIEAPTRLTVKPDGHRFWVAPAEDRDEIRDPDGEASLRTRVIEFTGSFEKVKWTCRAPLPSGKLCPRQDRVKCPFHGKIVGRDEAGKPTNPDDQKAEEERLQAERANEVPDWQDPKLLAELKESTGVDLRMPDKTKRGWRKHVPGEEKKYIGLTDIKASHNTTYSRLSKKVFQKSTMKRVAADLDKLDRKRFRDKYGDQFNYVFDH